MEPLGFHRIYITFNFLVQLAFHFYPVIKPLTDACIRKYTAVKNGWRTEISLGYFFTERVELGRI